jgi:hypothetical protein
MKAPWLLIPLAAAILTAGSPAATDLSGSWKVVYTGPPRTGPKTVGSMIFDFKIDGNVVTGTAHIGSWPGDAPIADGKIEGDRITFTATGHLSSTTGIPTCKLDVTVRGEEMTAVLSGLGSGAYEYKGKRKTDADTRAGGDPSLR